MRVAVIDWRPIYRITLSRSTREGREGNAQVRANISRIAVLRLLPILSV